MKNLKKIADQEKHQMDAYEFLDEQQKIEAQTNFMNAVNKKLIITYAVSCAIFAIPKLIRMFIEINDDFAEILCDALILKALVFILGYIGCRNNKYSFTIAASVMALLNITIGYTTGSGLRRVYSFIFESNIVFFFVILVIACMSVAVTIKYIGVQNHAQSAAYKMIDSKREYTEHMEKIERKRKHILNEETINSDIAEAGKTAVSADLGAEREKKENYMDEL